MGENQVLIVVLDANCSTQELAERIEKLRATKHIVAVRTIEAVVNDAIEANS